MYVFHVICLLFGVKQFVCDLYELYLDELRIEVVCIDLDGAYIKFCLFFEPPNGVIL